MSRANQQTNADRRRGSSRLERELTRHQVRRREETADQDQSEQSEQSEPTEETS